MISRLPYLSFPRDISKDQKKRVIYQSLQNSTWECIWHINEKRLFAINEIRPNNFSKVQNGRMKGNCAQIRT